MAEPDLGPDDLVLTLAADDSWLHAGTVSETIEHAAHHREQGAGDHGPARVDFFNVAGRRLVPVVGHDLVASGFRLAPGNAAPERLVARVGHVLDRAEAHLAEHPGGTGMAWPASARVPRPDGDLADVVAALRRASLQLDHGHAAGWFHNLVHALMG